MAISTVLVLAMAACGNSGDDDDDAGGSGNTTATTSGETDFTKNVPVQAPGVTDTEIQVAVITSKTNPLNGKFAELADGMNAYFDMVNADGGIYGRQLKITKERDDIIGLQNLEQVQASLAEDNAFATFLATLQFAGADALDAAGQPTFMWNISPNMTGHDNIFAEQGALCLGCTGHLIPWLAEQVHATTVGILAYGVDNSSKLCAAGDRDSIETYTDMKVGFFDDTLGFAEPNLSAQVSQMKEAGVDFVTTCMDINESIVLAKEMKKQGLDAVQHLPNGYDADLVAANADLLDGSIVVPQFVALENEPQIPEIKTYLAQMEKIGKQPIEVATMGWILAEEFVDGLKLAGPEFSQQKVIDGLNTVTDFSANGFVAPVDWTKQHEDPKTNPGTSTLECDNYVVVQDGKFVPQYGQPGKPWVCLDVDAPDLTEPTYMSFVPEDSTSD